MRLRQKAAAVTTKKSTVSLSGRSPAIETLEGRQLMSAAISGNVFNDLNASGALKAGDPGVANVRVYVDTANVGSYQASDPSVFTDSSGNYTISGLTTGTKIVREVVPIGFRQTLPTNNLGQHVPVATSSTHVQNINFGDTQKVRIGGYVFNDVAKDGVQQSSDPALAGVTMYLDTNGNGILDSGETSTTTDSKGHYAFDNLTAGISYTPRVDFAGAKAGAYAGWVQSYPIHGILYGATAQMGEIIDDLTFGIHAPAKLVYNSQVREVLATSGSNNQTYSSSKTGVFDPFATATNPAKTATATSQMASDISSGGIFAGGTLAASGFTSGDSAFAVEDVTFTLSSSTTYFLNYHITGDGFYFSLKDLTTGKLVVGPNQANPQSPHFSYDLSQSGTLAAGKYQLLFNNNNAAGQDLQTLGYSMNLAL